MKVINLTPHDIKLISCGGETIIEASGIIARCTEKREVIRTIAINGIEANITKTVFGDVENLPKQRSDTIYIVSRLVAVAEIKRGDLYFPDQLVRDDKGNIVGCTSLSQI